MFAVVGVSWSLPFSRIGRLHSEHLDYVFLV